MFPKLPPAMTKSCTIAAATALLCLLPAGCSESQASSVVGRYEIDSGKTLKSLGETQSEGETMSAEEKEKARAALLAGLEGGFLDLKADNTFASSAGIMGESSKGTWSIKDGVITLHSIEAEGQQKSQSATAKLSGEELEMTLPAGDNELTYYFKRQAAGAQKK